MDVHHTQPADNADAASSGTNSGAALEHVKTAIRANLETSQRNGMDSLRAFRDIGTSLEEAKEMLPKGEFGPWTEAEFGFSKQWRARLMKLSASWYDVRDALEWAAKLGRILGRKEYSVDGALALAAEFLRAMNPEAEAEATAKAEAREQAKAEKAAEKETEAEALRRMLAEAMERIAVLERELGKAHKKASGGAKEEKAAPEPDSAASGDTAVSPAMKAKAKKVHGLYKRGGTDGEKDAAKARLEEMASKCGLTLRAFLSACGLHV